MTPERAEVNMKFVDNYRSYVINYNVGKDLVKEYFNKRGASENHPEKRWELMEYILSTPQTPSGMSR